MESEILFTERQRFRQWWLWLILLGINGLFLFGVFKHVIIGQQFGDEPMGNTELLVTFGLTLLLTILVTNFRHQTFIRGSHHLDLQSMKQTATVSTQLSKG